MSTERDNPRFVGPALAYLVVREVEACRDFWSQALGLVTIVEDRQGGDLDFLLLNGPSEHAGAGEVPIIIEYQRYAGLSNAMRARLREDERAVVYLWLSQGLQGLQARFEATCPESVIEARTATYGADEIVVSDPHGHVFIFGQRHAAT